jgi:hypothetical protein
MRELVCHPVFHNPGCNMLLVLYIVVNVQMGSLILVVVNSKSIEILSSVRVVLEIILMEPHS